jgi:hypothetical protein
VLFNQPFFCLLSVAKGLGFESSGNIYEIQEMLFKALLIPTLN